MFNIKLVGITLAIDSKYKYLERLCHDYITDENAEKVISVTEDEIDAENIANETFSKGYLESLAIFRKLCDYLIDYNILLFHCSAVELDGRAYLFTAPSGTGKSTHTGLWKKRFGDRLTVINDDKPFLKFENDEIFVYGTPYAGKHNIQTNTHAKVEGVVYLHQSRVNNITRLTQGEAFKLLFLQTYRNRMSMVKTSKSINLVTKLCKIPVFKLDCDISDDAVNLAYNSLIGEK